MVPTIAIHFTWCFWFTYICVLWPKFASDGEDDEDENEEEDDNDAVLFGELLFPAVKFICNFRRKATVK